MKRILITLAAIVLFMGQAEAEEIIPGSFLNISDVASYDSDEVAIIITYENGITIRARNDGSYKIMEVDYTSNGTGVEGAIVGNPIDTETLGIDTSDAVSYQGWTYYSFTKNDLIVRIKADDTNTIREVSHLVNI
jgi:hypothetical protein